MSLFRSSLIVGAAAAASKILGFVRDVLFAQVLGAGPVADAFLAAFRLPNLIRRVLGEGGLNPAILPMLSHIPEDERPAFAGESLAGLGLVLLGATAVVELTAGLIVLLVAPGLGTEDETLALATTYTQLAFPLVLGVSLASFIAALLNQAGRFTAAALAPLALNGVLIGTLLLVQLGTDRPPAEEAAWIAAAATLGGFAQLAVVTLALARRPRRISPMRPRWSAGLAKLVATAFATLAASSAAQLFVLVGTQVASFLPSGVSWLYYADRLVQLPLGIIAAVVGIVLLTELTRHHGLGDRLSVIAAQNRALETALLIAMPACVALALLANPIAATLFERGAFGPEDTLGTAHALVGLSLSLPFAVAGKVLSQTLFARSATRQALLALALGIVASGAAALLLARSLGILGIGIGIAAGCAVHAASLARSLRRERLWALDGSLLRRLAQILGACACLGAALAVARTILPPSPGSLLALCLGGLAVYGAAAWALGAVTRDDLALLAKKA